MEPCHNGGECTITWNDFACSCPESFTGQTCETRVWCVSDPCIMGSQCVDLTDGYECKEKPFITFSRISIENVYKKILIISQHSSRFIKK